MDKKAFVLRYERFFSLVYRALSRNRIKVSKGNTIDIGNAFMKSCRIFIKGTNNRIVIEPGLTRLKYSSISVNGSGCLVIIGGGSNLNHTSLHIEDDNGSIVIKKHVTFSGNTNLAVIEGTRITIGEDCLFSAQIDMRTGDSHSILDYTTGKRINTSLDITIGEHVWIGNDVKLLKGASIGSHSIVGAGAILTAGDYPSHCIIGGIGHGKILKTNIDWCPQRIVIEK